MKTKKLFLGLFWIGLLFYSMAGFTLEGQPAEPPKVAPPIEPAAVTVRAPFSIVVNEASHVSVELTVPDRFIPLVGEDKVQEALKHGLVEFKPKTDLNGNDWTELLTIIPLTGTGGVPAYTFRDSVLANLKEKTTGFTTVNSAFKNEKEYQVATAIARYQLNGRTEILYFYAISGPDTMVSIQYIRAISPKEDLPKLINQLSALFAKNVKIIK